MAAIDTERATQTNAMPRDGLVRAVFPADLSIHHERLDDGDGPPILTGHFALFNQPTEINSVFEGNFMEQIAPGAFRKTFAENSAGMRVLFNHGKDPTIGDKVLGPIRSLSEDKTGAHYEVPLLDTSYNRDLIPGLLAGVYGASFRFKVMREEIVEKPEPSEANPRGLPERTITEARVMEFGPVTFPAYEGATAGIRSLTDRFRLADLSARDIEALQDRMDSEDLATLAEMIKLGTSYIEDQDEPEDRKNIPVMESALTILASLVPVEVAETEPVEPEDEEASATTGTDVQVRVGDSTLTLTTQTAPPHPDTPRRGTQDDDRQPATPTEEKPMAIIEDMRARQTQIRSELADISTEHSGAVLTGDVRTRWDELKAEWQDLEDRCDAETERHADLARMADDDRHQDVPQSKSLVSRDTGTYVTHRAGPLSTPDDVFDLPAYHNRARSQGEMYTLFTEGAGRAIERFHYPHPRADKDTVNAHLERLISQDDSLDKEISQRILNCGSPTYRAAFWKSLTKQPLSNEERTALAVGVIATGGAAVPPQIDPTLIPTASASINPLRAISRTFTTTSNIWKGVTSGGITSQYRAEGALMSDNSPTLTQPQLQPERADAFVPFSWELGQDWGTLEENLASELQDSKDQLEAVKFALGAGHGSNEPEGIIGRIIAGGGGTLVTTNLGTAFSVSDLYTVEAALPQRYIPNASWVATTGMFQKIRQFDTAGGASLWVQLQNSNPPELIGYPAYKATQVGTAGAALTATAIWGVFGDFSRFAIVDRVGLSVRFIENLFATSSSTAQITVPTGQSGLVAFWRNTSGILDSTAFRIGTISTGH